jgi:phenylacetate-CoA ligase
MGLYLKHMRGIGPCMFHAYPSSAHAFAKFILAGTDKTPQNVKGVLLESENVFADQIADIEKAFGARVFSSYGHSEKLVLAAQCEYTRDYHVWPTYGYFELLDAGGRPVQERGKEGEIVGTGFINTVVPFIRYRTGDYATYAGERCEACGREHTLLVDIRGRWPQGGLVAADGAVVSMTTLNVHDDTFRKVREYQFHQSVPGRATLWVVPLGSLDENEQRRITTNMNKRLQGQVVLDLEIRTELAKTVRGKRPRVIQQRRSSGDSIQGQSPPAP